MRPSALFDLASGLKEDLMHTIKGDLTLDIAFEFTKEGAYS